MGCDAGVVVSLAVGVLDEEYVVEQSQESVAQALRPLVVAREELQHPALCGADRQQMPVAEVFGANLTGQFAEQALEDPPVGRRSRVTTLREVESHAAQLFGR